MYVRYLQHQHYGTVQLLTMPLNTGSVRSKWSEHVDEDESGECEPVPLPIQTFLWRQTNPFLGAKIGKLHESSCVTFERVVVQNILHGISPSLSDAIASISRWRFVRSAFPHIVQCCGALLAVRANEDETFPMSGSLIKTLYILHWLVLDAAAECAEVASNGSNSGEAVTSVRQLTYSVPCIQMFVYLITPLCHIIKEEEIENHIRLESGLRLWQTLWQFRQPDILCFSAPVKQRRNQLPQLAVTRRVPVVTATEQGIYLGDDAPPVPNRRSSQTPLIVTSNASPAATAQKPSPIAEEKPLPNGAVGEATVASGIVRSVSDYKTSALADAPPSRLSLRKSRTDIFYPSPDNGMKDIDEAMKCMEENGSLSEIFHFNDRAPLVQLQEICSAASIDASEVSAPNDPAPSDPKLCNRCHKEPCSCSLRKASALEDSASISSQQTVINRTPQMLIPDDPKRDSASVQSEKLESTVADPHEASYLDIGVLRCLLIKNWSEDGVFWAVRYILNRLTDIRQFRSSHESTFRSRSNSVPTVAAARGSRHDILNTEYLTWADLQERASSIDRRAQSIDVRTPLIPDESAKAKVAFSVKQAAEGTKLKVIADQRRVSVNTLPVAKKTSRAGFVKRTVRSKSEPPLYQPGEFVPSPLLTDSDIGIPAVSAAKNAPSPYFPEANGSAMFIEKNGHLSVRVVLKIFAAVAERCSAVRILELILNGCDTLLTMPNCETPTFFEDIVKICLKTYVHLGCPNGCNEGMRTPQADFMRIKLKNLFSQMHRLALPVLAEILQQNVVESSSQTLLDFLHSMTAFCDLDVGRPKSRLGASGGRRRSSAAEIRVPSYRNNFNENLSGMEGFILNTILNPLITKLMNKSHELALPENMSLYQDVRMFVAYVQEYHGNPLRRTALSALSCRIDENGSESHSNSETTSTRFGPDGSLGSCQRDNASLRRGLFKKRGDKFATMNADESEGDSSPSTPRNVPSVDESMSNVGSPLLPYGGNYMKKKSAGKLHFVRNETSEDENWDDSALLDDSMGEDSGMGVNSDSRSRVSLRNAQRLSNFRQRQSLSIDNSFSELQDKSSNSEPSFLQLYLPPRRLLNVLDAREGARRFAFLLESCPPGQLPDAPLIAALMELKAPTLSRAVIFLECAHFVYRCNHGNWPEWIRNGGTLTPQRSVHTNSFTPGRPMSGGSRKAFLMQRAAGRCFYDWAIQIGARLQKMCEKEAETPKEWSCEEKRRLKLSDDVEDFLDDGTVNDFQTDGCSPALQLMAAHLLFQITAFLRETFQLIPRSKIAPKATGSTTGWEKLMSHRRWSILSNTFNQQTGSVHSINDLHPAFAPERRVSYSTADEESSPRGSHDLNDEQPLMGTDKKERSDGNSALLALHRFTSRGRLFSRETSLSTTTDDGNDHNGGATVRILRSQNTLTQTPSIAATVVGTMISVPESVRRLAQGRQRLLKRGSPSDGPQSSLESSRHRREPSFKVRKTSKSPTATDMDEYAESADALADRPNSFAQRRRKAASLRSAAGLRWHMRSMRVHGSPPAVSQDRNSSPAQSLDREPISPDPTTTGTDPGTNPTTTSSSAQSPIIKNGGRVPFKVHDTLKPASAKTSAAAHEAAELIDAHTSPERRSGATNSVAGSHHGASQTSHQPLPKSMEDDEEEMLKNMPWIKSMISVLNQFDVECSHERFCSPWCFDRVYRQCSRLTDSFRVVYDEASVEDKKANRRKQLLEGWTSLQESATKKRSSNPRRESAIVRQAGMERVPLALRGLLIEKLSEIEETKSAKKEGGNMFDTHDVDLSELHPKRMPIMNFVRSQLFNVIHSPLSAIVKSAVIMSPDQYKAVVNSSWSLLIHADANTVATAAAMFICCSVKCADECVGIIRRELGSSDVSTRTAAVRRFQVLWRNRFHVWLKMEDGAQMVFKVPPPGIDFTLPSPPIGQSQQPVVDPPWMPHVKTKVEELSLKEEEHSTSQTIMTMTRTRRKQKQEMVKKAVREAEERQYALRQQFPLRATAVVQQAAYEPALFHHQILTAQQQQNPDGMDDYEHSIVATRQQMPVAQPLFPSSILSVVPQLVEMFDDVQVDRDGCSVGDLCRKVAWNCIVEDSSLFLRHFLEKLTHKDKQEYLFALLRKILMTFRPLPSQTAYSLLNYLFGFVMFYVRTPCEGSDKATGLALSILWTVIPHVHGLYFKDLKQTLKKEQCDQALMITANVPSAKKIIVHGPDSSSGGIPSQFPIHEDTQFQQILTDSLEFFNIPDEDTENYFLTDAKTGLIHNPIAYVRDFYFFHRSFYPQLTLIRLSPEKALAQMKTFAFQQKLIETGKVLLTYNAVKHSPESVIPQRIFFLHDEFTHLPSFPRRSVESCFGMYQGSMGEELLAMDSMHKFVWSKLVSDMFEKMENAFMFGDLHLFINVINGIVIIHCEDVLIVRRCMATYITMAIHFNTLFASNGFFMIMPTLLRCYSQRQTNKLFKQLVEFVCKQFYILHRKPFLLQMFGSIADICDQNNNDLEINAMQVKAKYLFNLLLAMENINDVVDQLDILTLVPYPKPLKALDLCYRDDPNTFFILPDAVASCVTVCAFAPESKRSHQMLLIMQAIIPHFITHLELETHKQGGIAASVKHEINCYTTLCVEMKALINSCETLSRGPTRSFDIVNSVSERGKSFIADSPQFFDPPTVADDEPKMNSVKERRNQTTNWDANVDNAELHKEMFRGPRDSLLFLCSLFIEKATPRLKELSKLAASANIEHAKIPEVFDHKSHRIISDVALALLKVAPYDLSTMGCLGLQKYFAIVLPVVDWSVESNRSALNIILRRLDKTIAKIAKKPSARKRANWTAIGCWLNGLFHTLTVFPYIAHLHPLKTITQMCLRLTAGDHCADEVVSAVFPGTNPATIISASIPPPAFCQIVLRLTSFMMQALGQFAFSLEVVCSAEGVGMAADRLESVLCHILIPLFLMSAVPGKEAPQFQSKDIGFVLTLIQNTICPPLTKQTAIPSNATTALTTSLIRGGVSSAVHDASGRQGSVSVTDRGHSATVSTHRLIRDSAVQCVFLTLKVIAMVFHKQMTTHWVQFSKIVREIISKRLGGIALFNFVEFILSINQPISLMIRPFLQSKLKNHKPTTEQETLWFNELKDRVTTVKELEPNDIKGYNVMLKRFQQELQQMKEEFSTRMLEMPRSHTPTIGDLHSDSGSAQSVSTHRSTRPNSESRRLSSSTNFGKLRGTMKSAACGQSSIVSTDAGHDLHEATILEDIEDETAQMIGGKIAKSPSFPANRSALQQRARSITGLGMFRSMRRRSHALTEDEKNRSNSRLLEMREVHRRTKSWNKRGSTQSEDPILIRPLTLNESHPDASSPTSKATTAEKAPSERSSDRIRMVSFSTPKHSQTTEPSEAESEEYYITARHHLI